MQCSALACISKHSAPRLLFKAGRRASRTAFPRGGNDGQHRVPDSSGLIGTRITQPEMAFPTD
ncbi:DUF1534 domain-containing protein [Pseudomonas syringae pv. tomato]|nr:DUF1534 domain-containing protein [Pseudomonas syringae pv. tomato]